MRCTVSRIELSIYVKYWQQAGYGVNQGGLDLQLAGVVCRISWTVSVYWKLDVFPREGSRETQSPSLFLSLKEHPRAVGRLVALWDGTHHGR